MSKMNPLAGLIANYGDSDDESDDGLHAPPLPPKTETRNPIAPPLPEQKHAHALAIANESGAGTASAAIHPAPIAHCPWSACYDESSGFTYYWNQQNNAVTWEAPPEYLLALKLAQQQLHQAGSTEVSAEEWQLYQQALAEKQNSQNKVIAKSSTKSSKKSEQKSTGSKTKTSRFSIKRSHSDDEEEKIELITSYHNSDSDSNDEAETPTKPPAPPLPKLQPKPSVPHKKLKVKPVEYGPALPPSQNYTVPIGPELPSELINEVPKSPGVKTESDVGKEDIKSVKSNDDDSQDESELFLKLKNKARLLEKLGGEIPKELQKMIEEEPRSGSNTPKREDTPKMDTNIDDLLEEIEKKELPKVIINKVDIFDDGKSIDSLSATNSPRQKGDATPPIEARPLFPSSKHINELPPTPPLVVEVKLEEKNEEIKVEVTEKKGANLYLMNTEERIENVNRKKLRISSSVLPERKTNAAEEPAYTTKYSQFIEGFSSERTGLGFSKDEDEHVSSKNTIAYGNGLMFTKGETLNEDRKDEDLDDLTELLEAKLKYLNQLQPSVVTPVQEMLIQMQTLAGANRAGALSGAYWRRWGAAAARQLRAHEARAAPPGWSAAFLRSEGRYVYRRESDGLVQWEYPASTHTDMDISTTPPHPGIEAKEDIPIAPPLPPSPPPPPPRVQTPPPPTVQWGRARTPPPPAWADPPPPGCDDLPPLPADNPEPKQEIGDELASFYSDIAELEKHSSGPHTASNSPEPVEIKEKPKGKERDKDKEKKDKDKEKEKEKEIKVCKKKSKVKISTSMGLKHKSVSNLVAKWQQVADEINSD